MPFIPSPAVDLTGALNKFNTYNSLQLAMMSGLQNAFVANTNAAAAFGNGFPAGQVASNMNQLNPQQPPFYPPQQPLYVNNNGQPVYYRPGMQSCAALYHAFSVTLTVFPFPLFPSMRHHVHSLLTLCLCAAKQRGMEADMARSSCIRRMQWRAAFPLVLHKS